MGEEGAKRRGGEGRGGKFNQSRISISPLEPGHFIWPFAPASAYDNTKLRSENKMLMLVLLGTLVPRFQPELLYWWTLVL
jgi:hypothetical protein